MQKQATEAATNIQGSGWSTLAWEPVGQRLVVEQVHDHQGNIGNGTVPLLVLDMWEHAYYLQYLNVKEDWVKAFWKIVNWADVAERFAVRARARPVSLEPTTDFTDPCEPVVTVSPRPRRRRRGRRW